ncbi:MAG: VWA domain-containing protein, partial [Deltaproteobacteria bacterium]|nr:VWA domain-containing protein [Deltaproteobacteria bacterium]
MERAVGLRPGLLLALMGLGLFLAAAFPFSARAQNATIVSPAVEAGPALAQNDMVITPLPKPVPTPIIRPKGEYEVKAVELTVTVTDQKAKVHLRQTIKNTGSRNLELDYLVPLPANGAVGGLALVANGRELTGEIYEKDEAFKIYQDIVAKIKDPALLEFAGQGLFRARAFPVAGGAEASLDLSLDYLLPKDGGVVDFDFPLANSLTQGRQVGRQYVSVEISGPNVGGLFSMLEGVKVSKTGDVSRAEFNLENTPALSRFRLRYRDEAGPMGGMVLSHKPKKDEDGFFLFLAEPNGAQADRPSIPKTVIFALDVSGSMAGTKFRQAQDALIFILDRLGSDDLFNLVTYSSKAELWKPELEGMDEANREAAKKYVRGLNARGGTNIDQALKLSLGLNVGDGPAYLIFLTDGLPTEGVTNELSLADIAVKADKGRGVRIFTFGVGNDINARLLDRLSGGSSGYSTFVAPEENIEEKIASFFSKISHPALVKPELKVSVPVNRLMPEILPDVFHDSQLVVVGRYAQAGPANFTLSGRDGPNEAVFGYKADLADGPTEGGQQIAHIWAQRRIGELIDDIDQNGRGEPNSDQMGELLSLSKEFGIMTPYTSFLALEKQSLTDVTGQLDLTRQYLAELGNLQGASAVRQRENKRQFSGAVSAQSAPMPMSAKVSELQEMS